MLACLQVTCTKPAATPATSTPLSHASLLADDVHTAKAPPPPPNTPLSGQRSTPSAAYIQNTATKTPPLTSKRGVVSHASL